jgi:ribonuclease HI
MSATNIAQHFVPALIEAGFRAELFPAPLPNGYGHKITLSDDETTALGVLIVYHGKEGSRYVTSELSSATPEILARIEQAWISLRHTSSVVGRSATTAAPLRTPWGSIELWVDGACLSQPEGVKFGWAFVIQQDGRELMRHASHVIKSYMAPHRNVAAELQAVIHGLTHCRQMGYQTVTVFYDYAGIEQWATRHWKANTQTTQEYVRFIANCPLTITWQKVPAHRGVPMNELVDQLATSAAHASNEHHSV